MHKGYCLRDFRKEWIQNNVVGPFDVRTRKKLSKELSQSSFRNTMRVLPAGGVVFPLYLRGNAVGEFTREKNSVRRGSESEE